MTHWYIDFEAYHFCHTYYVKEICILKNDATICVNHHVKNPKHIRHLPYSSEIRFQMNRHHLGWTLGDVTFEDAMRAIDANVGSYPVYIKGHEKYCFLKEYLPNLYELPESPSFEKMTNCMNEVCGLHGRYCARRKVHELYFHDFHKQKLLT